MGWFRSKSRSEQVRQQVMKLMEATSRANMAGTRRSLQLSGADLRGADLSQLNLYVVSAGPVDLSFADLTEASLEGSNLNDANLQGAKFVRANASGLYFNGASCHGTDFTDAVLSNSMFNNCDFSDAILLRTDLRGARGFYLGDKGAPKQVTDCVADPYFLHSLRMKNLSDIYEKSDGSYGGGSSRGGTASQCFAALRTGDYEWVSTLLTDDANYDVGLGGQMVAELWSLTMRALGSSTDPAIYRVLPSSGSLKGKEAIVQNLRANAGRGVLGLRWEGCREDGDIVRAKLIVLGLGRDFRLEMTFFFSGSLICRVFVEQDLK